jgi:hypothetical protein
MEQFDGVDKEEGEKKKEKKNSREKSQLHFEEGTLRTALAWIAAKTEPAPAIASLTNPTSPSH